MGGGSGIETWGGRPPRPACACFPRLPRPLSPIDRRFSVWAWPTGVFPGGTPSTPRPTYHSPALPRPPSPAPTAEREGIKRSTLQVQKACAWDGSRRLDEWLSKVTRALPTEEFPPGGNLGCQGRGEAFWFWVLASTRYMYSIVELQKKSPPRADRRAPVLCVGSLPSRYSNNCVAVFLDSEFASLATHPGRGRGRRRRHVLLGHWQITWPPPPPVTQR